MRESEGRKQIRSALSLLCDFTEFSKVHDNREEQLRNRQQRAEAKLSSVESWLLLKFTIEFT